MTGMPHTPTATDYKAQARRLRAGLADTGHGVRDWNTLNALAARGRSVADLTIGSTVAGRYLGHDFTGELVALHALSKSGRYRASIQFDTPVDVVAFDSFSAFRRRVTVTVDATGATTEKTSDGRPHLQLAL